MFAKGWPVQSDVDSVELAAAADSFCCHKECFLVQAFQASRMCFALACPCCMCLGLTAACAGA